MQTLNSLEQAQISQMANTNLTKHPWLFLFDTTKNRVVLTNHHVGCVAKSTTFPQSISSLPNAVSSSSKRLAALPELPTGMSRNLVTGLHNLSSHVRAKIAKLCLSVSLSLSQIGENGFFLHNYMAASKKY